MIVLASASPRRIELLSKLTARYIVEAAHVEEVTDSLHPADIVMDLATLKAAAVAINHPCDTVIGADTLVWYDGEALGKPSSKAEAFECLKKLSGNVHSVYTGVCVIKGGRQYRTFDLSRVRIRDMSDDEIVRYVEGGSPMDKAGAYGIQDGVACSFSGSYDNIVGFPTELIAGLPVLAEDL
ncbi:MAG: Maf family protein [Clostridia bacterium]|nr:Maf family protein [Clostridia bacterium]